MRKTEFLDALRVRLRGLPQADIEASCEYYGEIIDDRMEDGLSEEEAVAAVGTVDAVAAQILHDTPLPKLMKERIRPKRALRAWEIVLLALGSPVWLPLIASAVIVVFSVYLTLWAVSVSLYAADLAIALSALAVIVGAVFLPIPMAARMLLLGGGLLCAGIAILLFLGCNQAAKGIIWIGRQLVGALKRGLLRREETA